MKKNLKLYIGNELVELSSESVISLNYALEDTTNPTIVKNLFSRSVDIPGTPQNNRIFGRFYDLTRRVSLSTTKVTGIGFNPLKRTPFSLYVNSELVEQGYIQLNKVARRKGGIAWYTITLFGGLGDFFYNLMYDENGEKRTLASLDFGIDGATSVDAEMDFIISKDRVNRSWNALGDDRNSIDEVITHIPAYNGVPSDFDAEHALINTRDSQLKLPTSLSSGGKSYSPYNGYGLVEFPSSLDEWETRDLRSYLQRPALSLRALINAIKNPANNGGYTVNLDSSFFSEYNSLFQYAYITLPMLKTTERETPITEIAISSSESGYIGGVNKVYLTEISLGDCSVAGFPNASKVTVNIPISLQIDAINKSVNDLYVDCAYQYKGSDGYFHTQMLDSAIVARVIVKDGDEVVAVSQNVAFSHYGRYAKGWETDYNPSNYPQVGIANVKGHFVKNSAANSSFAFLDDKGNNTFPIVAEFVKGTHNNITCSIQIYRAYRVELSGYTTPDIFYVASEFQSLSPNLSAIETVSNLATTLIAPDGMVSISEEDLPTISTGTKITKQLLLSGTHSPADYLLSYAKLFGLRFIKDATSKTITVTSKYFKNNIVDISDRIDVGSDIEIVPNVFDTKFMRLALEMPDTYLASKYRSEHGVDYGQKRIDTAYEFNNETKDVYSGNVFKHAVPCRAISRLFYNYQNSDGNVVHPPIADNPKYSLFLKTTTEGIKNTSVELDSNVYIDSAKTIRLNAIAGYDTMPKMCYFGISDGQREPVDIANNLVIYCGNFTPTDINGNNITYWLTDDLAEMVTLNGKPCYLLTESPTASNGTTVAIKRTSLPLFLSMRLVAQNNTITASFDFAVPKESFIGDVTYNESVTLYSRYWERLYTDRIDVDTRKVIAMVNLAGFRVSAEMLRVFYYFDGCYWLLNKIMDYNPAVGGLTKCEFIKVKDISNYYNGSDDETVITIE